MEIPGKQIAQWIGIILSKFHDCRKRYGKVNVYNGWISRDWWLEDWEKQTIIEFHDKNLLEGYRRLTFMMLDANVVTTSPSSVYRALSDAGLIKRHNTKPSLGQASSNQSAHMGTGTSTLRISTSSARSFSSVACSMVIAGRSCTGRSG
jgi:hypothetical protein